MRGRSLLLSALIALAPLPSSAALAPAAFRATVPPGSARVTAECLFQVTHGEGVAVAAVVVTPNGTSAVEASAFAIYRWNHASATPSLTIGGVGVQPGQVQTALVREKLRVRFAMDWGGPNRTWTATMRSGCGSIGSTVESASAAAGSSPVTRGKATLIAATPSHFHGLGAGAVVHGAAGGAMTLDARVAIAGVFDADAGVIGARAPDGRVLESGPQSPEITLDAGGPWSLSTTASVNAGSQYLVAALRFDA